MKADKTEKAKKIKKVEKKEKGDKKVKAVKEKGRMPLSLLLIITSLIPLVLSVVIVSATSFNITKNNLEDSAKNTLYIASNNLANFCIQNEVSVINASQYFYYLDSLKDRDIEMAILLEDGTCVTSIKNANDYRIREIAVPEDMVDLTKEYFDNSIVIDEKEYCAYYMPIIDNGELRGMAFAGELESNVTGEAQSVIVIFVVTALVLIVLFAVIMLLFTGNLVKAFEAVDKNVNGLANGSLAKGKVYVSPVREMNTMLKAAALMQENLSTTIGKVKNVSQTLVENIAEATTLSKSSSDRARQITASMESLSDSSAEMSRNVQDIHEQMTEIGSCVNDITGSVEQLQSSSENILHTNDEARRYIDTIMENSKQSVGAVRDIASQIQETNESIAEIDRAVELILSISEQTNLLSLNAAIEAARAGENGRGFGVVAEEIGKLAQQSADGAEMIKNLARTIVEKSERSVQLADGVRELILSEQDSVSKTQSKYAELSEELSNSVNEINSIAEKTVHLTEYKERVIGNVQELSGLSDENTKNTEEVNANVSEIISEVQLVSDDCERMNRMAGELESSVSYFHD